MFKNKKRRAFHENVEVIHPQTKKKKKKKKKILNIWTRSRYTYATLDNDIILCVWTYLLTVFDFGTTCPAQKIFSWWIPRSMKT